MKDREAEDAVICECRWHRTFEKKCANGTRKEGFLSRVNAILEGDLGNRSGELKWLRGRHGIL